MAFTYTTRKDGRLMKRVSVNGKLKTLYSDNPKDLERQYTEYKYLSNKGIIADDENMTVSDWADKWLTTYKSDKEKATIKMYENAIRLHIKPNIGNIALKNLKQSDIVNMLNVLTKKGITRKKDVALLTIKQILDKAVENDYIYKNVASGIKIKKHKAPEKEPLQEHTIDIVKKLSKTNPNAFMVLFMIYTGLRREEIVPLQYKNINLEEKYIEISNAVYFEHNQPVLKGTKNSDTRKVPIFNIIFDTLKNMFDTHNKNDYIFTNQKQGMMSETCIRRKFESVIKLINDEILKEEKEKQENDKQTNKEEIKQELITFTPHQLRHTYVCILHKAGIDIKQAQIWTGHRDVRVLLNIYTHLDSQDNQKSIDKVNQFLA